MFTSNKSFLGQVASLSLSTYLWKENNNLIYLMELLREVYEKIRKALGTLKNSVSGGYLQYSICLKQKLFFIEEFSTAKQNPIPV